MKRRVVITGLGWVTSLGEQIDEVWDGLIAGKSGIGPVTRFDPSPLDTRIAAVSSRRPPNEERDHGNCGYTQS